MVQAVQIEAREAAMARWDAPGDVFVWRARRCTEAVLYAVLSREGVDIDAIAKQRKGLDGLIEHKQLEGTLSRETRAQLKTLQEFGNIAAHFQIGRGVSDDSVDAMSKLLAALLREFYAMDGGSTPEGVRPYLAALTDRDARIRSAAEIEGDRARQRVRELESQLRTAQSESAASRASAPRDPGPRRVAMLAGVALVGAMGGFLAGRGNAPVEPATPGALHDAIPPHAPPPEPRASAPPPEAPAPQPVAPPAPSAPDVPAPAPAPIACPSTMVRVGEACVDREPVLTRAYRQCVATGQCSRPQHGNGCNWQNGRDDLAVNCVTWEMARGYCRWAYPQGGDLPNRAAWPPFRAGGARLRVGQNTREWGIDVTTESALVGNGLGFTTRRWMPSSPNAWARDLGFRCALVPTAARP